MMYSKSYLFMTTLKLRLGVLYQTMIHDLDRAGVPCATCAQRSFNVER
jgi:hypothetical protein